MLDIKPCVQETLNVEPEPYYLVLTSVNACFPNRNIYVYLKLQPQPYYLILTSVNAYFPNRNIKP